MEIFNAERPGKKLFCIPLALKDFGKPTEALRTDYVTFVSFGAINEDKNVKLLIQAAEKYTMKAIDSSESLLRAGVLNGIRTIFLLLNTQSYSKLICDS